MTVHCLLGYLESPASSSPLCLLTRSAAASLAWPLCTPALDTGPGSSGRPLCELIYSLHPVPPLYLHQAPGGVLPTRLLLAWHVTGHLAGTGSARASVSGVRVLQGKLTGGERDQGALWRASLEGGMLKGSFVSEPEIRLQLFVSLSRRAGGPGMEEQGSLQSKGCRSKKPCCSRNF